MPEIINLTQEFNRALEMSTKILNDGGLIVFPTDTVYGLAAKYDILTAVRRIFLVKDRDQTKALPVIIGDISQVDRKSVV